MVACLLLPFLIDFGAAEFMGTLLKKPFLLAFRLPGRASIDSLASWLGSGSVGVLITIQQHERGNYSGREAAIITTNFSIASIAFCVLVTKVIEIDHMFFEFYFSGEINEKSKKLGLRTYCIYRYDRRSFYPFVPTGDKEGDRDRASEAVLANDMRKSGLNIETTLTEWMGLWGIPF